VQTGVECHVYVKVDEARRDEAAAQVHNLEANRIGRECVARSDVGDAVALDQQGHAANGATVLDVDQGRVDQQASAQLKYGSQPMAPVWLGIDLGTGGCRTAAVADNGTLLATAEIPLRSLQPRPGWHEQDPELWKTAVSAACRAALSRLDGTRVAGVALCGTSGTLLLGDANGRPRTRAVMYDDVRAAEHLPSLAQIWAPVAERNAYRIQPTWGLPRLAWLLEHLDVPRDVRLYHCPDFVATWLVGEPTATDTSHALKTGYDQVAHRWPEAAFESAGIPVSLLPPVVSPGTLLGRVCAAGADATGLTVGTRVVAGMTDGCASQIASGTLRPGQWNSALGTTFVLKGVTKQLLRDPAGAVYSHAHPDGGWLPGGASSAGAGALRTAFPAVDLAHMDRAVAARGPTDVVRYPLSAPGERFPFVRPDAQPFELGRPRDEVEAFSAILQAVAFVERLSLDYVKLLGADVRGTLAFTGGATRSALWTQLRADVLGRAVQIPRHADSAVGMAILAAAGSASVAHTADRMVTIDHMIEPRLDCTERYLPIYRRMVDELERREYIGTDLAAAARSA
jgi:sugar (pentulose or hexulose) kinase